jgi:hypothetical protein
MQNLGRDAKTGERLLGRFIAFFIGAFGAVVLLIVNFVLSAKHALFGGAQTHGWYGLAAFLVGAIGATLALFVPKWGAALMAISAVGFIFIAHVPAIIATPILLIGALIAFLDRSKLRA